MNKKILSLLCMLYLILPLSAQYRMLEKNECYLGAAAGVTFSTASLQPLYADKSYQQGWEGGFIFRYIAEKNFGIESGLLLSQCGWADDYGYQSPDYYRRTMSFAEIPFLMHAYLESGKARFFLNAGPKFSYFLQETESYNNEEFAYFHPYYNKAVETYFQWGIMGNVGFEFHFGQTVCGVSGGYYYGLSDVFHNRVTDPFVASSIQQINGRFFILFQTN